MLLDETRQFEKVSHTYTHTNTQSEQYDIVVETAGGRSKGQEFSREQKSEGLNTEELR